MDSAEVVVHVVDRDRGNVIFDLFGECIRQAREAAHLHPHREVLPLDVAGRDVLRIGIADLRFLLAAKALGRRVACLRGGLARNASTVDLHQYGVIDVTLKRIVDRVQIPAQAVGRQLNAVCETALRSSTKSGRFASCDRRPSTNTPAWYPRPWQPTSKRPQRCSFRPSRA